MLIEAHDEWQVSDRRYLSEESMATLTTATQTTLTTGSDTPSEVINTRELTTA